MNLHSIPLHIKVALAIFLVALSVYVMSACRYNPGYADSDEMITIGYLLGSAHPSGYPLQMWLTKLFTLLPIPGTVAFRANIMNSFFHALTVVCIYFAGLLGIRIMRSTKEQDVISPIEVTVAAAGALLLAFSGLFWMYSGIAEVGALNDFFASLTLVTSLQWYNSVTRNAKPAPREYFWFVLTWALAGLGMTHVHTYILLYPGLGIILLLGLFKYKRFGLYGWFKVLLPLFVFAVCFIVPNLSLLYLNSRKQNVSWYFEQSISGWYNHLRRKVYSGYIPEKDMHVTSYIAKIDVMRYIKGFPFYWEFMTAHFSIFGVIAGLFGLSWIWIKKREVALIVSALVLTTGLFIGVYMGVPDQVTASLEYRSLVGISHRQYLIGETVWGFAIILGLWGIVDLLQKELKNLFQYQ